MPSLSLYLSIYLSLSLSLCLSVSLSLSVSVSISSSLIPHLTTSLIEEKQFYFPLQSFGCDKLDNYFGGIFWECGITEISGEAGLGKTQLGLQLGIEN